MKTHWFIIANQTGAKIFLREGREKLTPVQNLENPLGGERSRDLHRKKTGVSSYSPHEDALVQFAREIDEFLQKSLYQQSFSHLTIVAEPHFLGKLKSAMTGKVLESVVEWIEKDLSKVSEHDLPGALDLKNNVEPVR
jgi:protein required for attachment to host cells